MPQLEKVLNCGRWFSILNKDDDCWYPKRRRENRECVYQFVAPDDQRDSIFGQWFNRDEAFSCDSVSVTNNIELQTPGIDTESLDIPQTLLHFI